MKTKKMGDRELRRFRDIRGDLDDVYCDLKVSLRTMLQYMDKFDYYRYELKRDNEAMLQKIRVESVKFSKIAKDFRKLSNQYERAKDGDH